MSSESEALARIARTPSAAGRHELDPVVHEEMEGFDRMVRKGADKLLGPSARLGGTAEARTLRGPGNGMVIDGPFAETKEQLLGLYVVNCADEDAAIAIARDLRRVNPSAVYEIRPIRLYLPGESLPETAQEDGQA